MADGSKPNVENLGIKIFQVAEKLTQVSQKASKRKCSKCRLTNGSRLNAFANVIYVGISIAQ